MWYSAGGKSNLQVGPTHQTHQSTASKMALATTLPDIENCGPAEDKYDQNILRPQNHDMNLYTTDQLFAQYGANVPKLN